MQGYRIIACAYKLLDSLQMQNYLTTSTRTQLENELIFVGFLILENKLKASTQEVILKLK